MLGGLEKQNYSVCRWLSTLAEVRTIVNPYGKKFLAFFLPWCLLKTIWLAPRYDVVLLGDGVLAMVGWVLKKIYPEKVVTCILHGLDITYSNRIYQHLWPQYFLNSLDHLFAVSDATANQAIIRSIAETKISIIPNGVDPVAYECALRETDSASILENDLANKKILITVGRLVRRKGINWFIREVMPTLDEDVVYILVGSGPETGAIKQTIIDKGLENRIFMVGTVSETEKWMLLSKAHLFVQPNVRVKDDMEGFGIAVLEANAAGLFVVASRLEGLRDAIVSGKNGYLLDPENPQVFSDSIIRLMADLSQLKVRADQAREFCKEHFYWSVISRRYYEKLEGILTHSG